MTIVGLAGRRAHPRTLRDPALLVTIVVLWVLLALFVIYPLLMLAGTAFIEEGRPALGPLASVLAKPGTQRAFLNSLLLGTLVGIIGTALGFLFAFTVSRANLKPGWVRVIDAMTLLPLISPPFTTSIAFIFSFGPRGLITYELLGMRGTNVYGLPSTMAAEVLTYFPIAYLALRPVLAAIGGNLEEMAFSLGSSRFNVFRTVTIPLAVPGLANAFLLLFAASLADFATPLILAGNAFPVLPTEAYLQITGLYDLKGGAMLSLLLLVPAAIVYFLQRKVVARRRYVTMTGKGRAGASRGGVAPWTGVALLAFCLMVVLFILYLYA